MRPPWCKRPYCSANRLPDNYLEEGIPPLQGRFDFWQVLRLCERRELEKESYEVVENQRSFSRDKQSVQRFVLAPLLYKVTFPSTTFAM